jgi:hypothetical protein
VAGEDHAQQGYHVSTTLATTVAVARASTLTKNTWLCMIIHGSVDQIIKQAMI